MSLVSDRPQVEQPAVPVQPAPPGQGLSRHGRGTPRRWQRDRLDPYFLGPLTLDGPRRMRHPVNMWESEFSGATVLTELECFEHLGQVSLGRIAVSIDALPVILPVHFALTERSVHFRACTGSKFDAATTGAVVAFQADAEKPLNGEYWSVLLQGIASSVGDASADAQGRPLRLGPWADLQENQHMVRIEATIVSGRKFRIAGEGPSMRLPEAPRLRRPPGPPDA